jgi:peptide/nickel transport system substrate-binding protein
MKRRNFLKGLSLAAAAPALPRPALAQKSARDTLRIIRASNLASLDPIWTTDGGPKDYAFLTFDQLMAVDANYVPQPQMAEGWSVEDDGRTYVIGLREGLKFHDGVPVRSHDCIPSIQRWGVRDGFGQMMMRFVDAMEVIDDRRFRIRLKKPFPLLPAALGKSNSSQCFIMPERMARTDPMKPVTESIGSGPYRFLRDEWIPGAHAAWARFDGYIPRKEPVSGIAGGRIPAIGRVEWAIITDPSTAMAALMAGEQDYWEMPEPDLIPVLKTDPNITVEVRSPLGGYVMLQLNHLQPPFNNPAIRQAVAMAIDQTEFLRAVTTDPALIKPCISVYACGTANASEAGADVLKVRSVEKAKAALKAAGYAGEKAVILGVMSTPSLKAASQVAEDLLGRLGMNVELVAMDFATMAQRRANKEPPDKGGWSIFPTAWAGTDILNPAVHQMLRAGGLANGWWGWADDPVVEELRDQWASAVDPAEQLRLATAIQVEALKTMIYIPIGNFVSQVAYRNNVTGVFPAPVFCYWNIGKRA